MHISSWLLHTSTPVPAFECDRAVATLTLRAELPEMHVVLFMACAAIGGQFRFRRGFRMARMASYFFVCTGEWERCPLGVIELPYLPATRRMACIAIRAKFAFVYVLGSVAIVTSLGRPAEFRRAVAASTWHVDM